VGAVVTVSLQEHVWLQAVKACEVKVAETERQHSEAVKHLQVAIAELRRARGARSAPTLTDVPPLSQGTRVIDMRNGRAL
jgi:hypothetical protein